MLSLAFAATIAATSLSTGLVTPAAPAAETTPVESVAARTQVVERTFLKANAGKREALAQFIAANWFAMDRRGVEQGLFTFYRLSENLEPDGEWDLEVAVGYANPEGYRNAEVQTRFEAIRRAHTTLLIDGQSLNQLGTVVRTERLRPREEQ